MKQAAPIVEQYGNISVVREDLVPGGTKARFVDYLFEGVDEVVYATPAQGGAQTALALAARRLGKRLTLFVAARKEQHPRIILSERIGACIVEVKLGYLSNVQAKARNYTEYGGFLGRSRVRNLQFGLNSPEAVKAIAAAAVQIPRPSQLWCSAGSGTLACGLAKAWPNVPRFVVSVGHKLIQADVGGGTIIVYPKPYGYEGAPELPFPSDPIYERKTYQIMLERVGGGSATFWNTAASVEDEARRCFVGEGIGGA
jgi:hypothetical protein